MSSNLHEQGTADTSGRYNTDSVEFPSVEADSVHAQNRAAFVAGLRGRNVAEVPSEKDLNLGPPRQEAQPAFGLENALESLSISSGRGRGQRSHQSQPSEPSWRGWSPPGAAYPVADIYGTATMQPGQVPMQWIPYHPGMAYPGMYGEPRPGLYYDHRISGPPQMYQAGIFPAQGLSGPFPGSLPGGARYDTPISGSPAYFLHSRAQTPIIRQRNPRPTKGPQQSTEMYDFSVEEAEQHPDTCRKTLMLRNIPNKYSIHMLLEMLDNCHRKGPDVLVYDFCYLPIDFKNRCNLGYAFVNFVEAESTLQCYETFHEKRWNDFNSKKVCEVKYGRVQGREALIEHFKNSKFPSNDRDSLPLLFEHVTKEDGTKEIRSVPLLSKQPS